MMDLQLRDLAEHGAAQGAVSVSYLSSVPLVDVMCKGKEETFERLFGNVSVQFLVLVGFSVILIWK